MATTEPDDLLPSARRTHRFLRGAAGLSAALLLGAGALQVARGGDDAAPPPSFWSLITPVVYEVDPPTSVDEVAARADAIVVAHVSGVRDGREQKGFFDPTPALPGNVAPSRTVFVELTVSRVVAGGVAVGDTLDLELVSPPKPLTLDDVRALVPTGELLMFLDNSGQNARRAGFGSRVGAEEDRIWKLASQKGVLAEGSAGMYDALDPNRADPDYLRSFGLTLDAAVERTEAALG
jgi:hypothetical protein